MPNDQSAIALLLFRVGPVLCCAPADPVQTIIAPPKLTRPPGSNEAKPGIFYHANHVISVSELRHRFGVNEAGWEQPGRLIITLQDVAFTAYWVDEIIEVIDTPKEGWSEPSSHLPQGVFSKTLLLDEKIYLFADFANFENLPESGYLSQYIDKLAGGLPAIEATAEIVEDKPQAQAEPIAASEADSSPVTESEAHTQTKTETPPDALENDAATETASVESNSSVNETKAQLDIDQRSQLDEIEAPEASQLEPPPLEPATPKTETRLDMTDSSPKSGLPTQEELTRDSEITETVSASQTDPGPDISPHDIEADSAITEITDAIPDTVDSNHPVAVDEKTAEPITEIAPTSAEKAARLKTEYLDPVPAVVPESEQEPVRPPFPWKNLAAAVVLFITVASIGIYYSWSSPGKAVSRATKSPEPPLSQKLDLDQKEIPDISRHKDDMQAGSTAETKSVASSNTNDQPDSDTRLQDKNDYHAEIKPDHKGITIVLHSPESEPALKTRQQAVTVKTLKKNDNPATTGKRKKQNKPGREEIIHIVVKGDTLWAIAKHYVNNPYKYPRLARLSKIKNPDRIYPGNRVRILRHDKNAE